MQIVNGELSIRSAVVTDAPFFGKAWRDGEIMVTAGFPNGLDVKDEDIVRQIEGHSIKLLVLEADGEAIGEMHYKDEGEQTASFGIKIYSKEKRGQGLGSRFIQMLLAELFNNHGCERIIVDAAIRNIAAQRTYQGIGFKEVQVVMGSWVDQLGQSQGHIDYELIKANFQA